MKKTKILLSALITVAMCVSLISGATFALFTSQSNVDITVTSGKVRLSATAELVSGYSAKEDGGKYEYEPAIDGDVSSLQFAVTGIASYNKADNVLTLDRIVPGDGVLFNINVENESTVDVKYQTVVTYQSGGVMVEGELHEDNALYRALKISVGEGEGALTDISSNRSTAVSGWQTLKKGETVAPIAVSIEMPLDVTTAQDMVCNIAIGVYAVQANGNDDTNRDVYLINSHSNLNDVVSSMGDNGGTLALSEDVTLNSGNAFSVPTGNDVVVDTQNNTLVVESGTTSAISVPANSSLTIKGQSASAEQSNVVLNSATTSNAAVDVSGSGAKLNLENVEIKCENACTGRNNKPSITARGGAQVNIGEGAKISASEMKNKEAGATGNNYQTYYANANILEASGRGTVVTIDGAEISTQGSGCGILTTGGAELNFESGKITISAGGGASALAIGDSSTVRMTGGLIEVTGDLAAMGGASPFGSLNNTAAAIGDTLTYSDESNIIITGGEIRLTPTSGIAIAVAMEGASCWSSAYLGGDLKIYVDAQGSAEAYAFAAAQGDTIGICEDVLVHGAKKDGVLHFGDAEFILYDSAVFNSSGFVDKDWTDFRYGYVDDHRGQPWDFPVPKQ